MENEDNPYAPGALHTRDPLHDLQLLRDMQIVNEHTQRELGPLPPGGLPVEPRRRPSAPYRPLPPRHDLMETPEMNLTTMAAAAVLAGAATACAHKEPEIRLNPQPQERYEIMVTFGDVPGQVFEKATGSAFFYVRENDCRPYKDSLAGVLVNIEKRVPVAFERVNENSYRAYVYPDYFLNEDYYGKGICRWTLGIVSAGLENSQVRISASIGPVPGEKAKTTYFSWEAYRRSSSRGEQLVFSGSRDPSRYGPDRQNDLYTVTMTAKRIVQ